jgi:Uma2 family endonuclease
MATVSRPSGERLVLYGVAWTSYVRILRALGERPIRVTYDRGVLEIMTLGSEHECFTTVLSRLVIALTEELGLPLAGYGSMTMKRRPKKRGFEPDECYWIASEPLIRGKIKIDVKVDPPPDLALEIEVTRSALNRMAIYAAMGVREVWRFDTRTLTFHVLDAQAKYQKSPESQAFPTLLPAELAPFLALRQQMNDNEVVRQFRAWVCQQIAAGRWSATQP